MTNYEIKFCVNANIVRRALEGTHPTDATLRQYAIYQAEYAKIEEVEEFVRYVETLVPTQLTLKF